ncbi:MAG: glycosyltransferase [Bacteroidales bacterium]|nr:glycosyltransferase [Bacteroidales bacterium]MCF8405617.1 glycosyltransferase [Bacteroidales bacterium]
MIKNKDIVVIGIQPWDIKIGSNCKNIATEFSKNNRVLYVNAPLDRGTMIKEKDSEKVKTSLDVINKKTEGLIQINENMWNLYPETIIESSNWLPKGKLFDLINKRNNKKFARSIEQATIRLGFKDYLLFNDQHMFLGFYLKEMLNPLMYIYYMRDNLIKNPYWKKHGTRIEALLIQKADLVTNNSLLYTEYGAKYNKASYMVGQGCDTSLFYDEGGRIPIADELKKIPKPIIGYVGYLTSRRLDIGLLEFMAKERQDWNFVYVGPEDEKFESSGLHTMSNVHFLGSRNEQELPKYVKGFDIAINPQLVNDATIGNYPRKIDEYLAMGKATLATSTKAMEYFRDVTYLAKNREEYIELAEKALKEDSPELQKKRIATGRLHSWENSVNEIYKAILKEAEFKNIRV